MTLLQCDNVTFGYGGDTLFRDVTFTLGAGERIGLVAPNGAGKTTLLKILSGELTPEGGRVLVPSSVKVGYMRQVQHAGEHATVLDALLSGYDDLVQLRADLHHALEAAATGEQRALSRLADLQDRYEHAGGHALEHEVESLAGSVGFTAADMPRLVHSLSGGERGRLALGVVLASKPRVLLLDEPTNHLDLVTVERLEGWLRAFQGAVVLVSHDRAFLDHTTTHTGELGSSRFRLYHAPYSHYLELREADLERETATVERQRDEIARTEDFIRRNIAGQKTKQAQSRRKQLAKVERLDRPEDVWGDAKRMAFRFAPAARSGDIALDVQDVGASRGGRRLFAGVELLLRRGERIGIVGPNGAGKSTLLKILAGRGEPGDEGTVKRGTNLQEGYFDQHLESLDPGASAIDEIRKVRPDLVPDAVRTYLARFRIQGDDPFRPTGSFSGGERTRIALAKLLLVPRNLMFMDEPTNHLDIPASEILEEALAEGFEGSVVLVSHDRFFLDRVCTRILHLEAGVVQLYHGGYSDWREALDRAQKASEPPPAAKKREPKSQPPPEKAKDAKPSYEQLKQKAREAERVAKRVKTLEEDIQRAEAEAAALKEKLLTAGSGDWAQIAKMAEQEQALQRKIAQMMDEWAKLSEAHA